MGARRVLQVLGPSTGGIRAHVLALRDGLRARGWEVTVAGPRGVLGAEPVDVAVPIPAGARPADLLRAWQALRGAAPGVDLLHAHGLKAGWVASAVPGRPPLVLTVHNAVLPGRGGRAEPLLHRLEAGLPRRADAVIATSPELAQRLAGQVRPDRCVVVRPVGPRPVPQRTVAEVRALLGLADAAPLVVGVGRLHPQKGWPFLIEAVRELARTHDSLVAVIAGEGPDRDALRGVARNAGMDRTVRFVGPVANPADLLAAADVVVAPSVWESGPLVVAEALWLGRPVVATPLGFVPDLVVDGETGWIVPVGDAGALAKAIDDVLADPGAAGAVGEAGRRRVADVLDPDRLIGEVEAVYRALLDGGGPG